MNDDPPRNDPTPRNPEDRATQRRTDTDPRQLALQLLAATERQHQDLVATVQRREREQAQRNVVVLDQLLQGSRVNEGPRTDWRQLPVTSLLLWTIACLSMCFFGLLFQGSMITTDFSSGALMSTNNGLLLFPAAFTRWVNHFQPPVIAVFHFFLLPFNLLLPSLTVAASGELALTAAVVYLSAAPVERLLGSRRFAVLLVRLFILRLALHLAILPMSPWIAPPSCAWLVVSLCAFRRLLCSVSARRFSFCGWHLSDMVCVEALAVHVVLITPDARAVPAALPAALYLCSRMAPFWNITSDGDPKANTVFNSLFSPIATNASDSRLQRWLRGRLHTARVTAQFFPPPGKAEDAVKRNAPPPQQDADRTDPRPQPAATQEYQPSDTDVQQLAEMGGFDRNAVVKALKRTRGNLDAAFNLLLDGGA